MTRHSVEELEQALEATGMVTFQRRKVYGEWRCACDNVYYATTGSAYVTFTFNVSNDYDTKTVVVRLSDHMECYPPHVEVDVQLCVSPDELTLAEAVAKLVEFAKIEESLDL